MKKYLLIATLAITAVVVTSCKGCSSFTDSRDGQTYRMVKIGEQTWMAQNLNFQMGNSWCYDNAESNCQKYGRLYDWNTAMTACPKGWRLPTNEDWNNLIEAAGDENVAGRNLKSRAGWDLCLDLSTGSSINCDGNGTDEFDFSALPGGTHDPSSGSFNGVGGAGGWWTATESDSDYAYVRSIESVQSMGSLRFENVQELMISKDNGSSIRCVR
ncbi:MAG: fibrobacter succinogenes major paralogous domain-containing protein [Fibromonadaceae bacterium]|jgi:uncharacterized protein (TIGR02145 family)|nr:fibrobacter succinogenes major paralogous domain-containing protein [Fibromonadaceae bacterium]